MPDTNSTVNSAANTSIILGFLMSLLAFFIVVGNAVVILAFMVDKNLRHRSNYFFLNLAISDFFVVSEAWKNGSHECEPGFFSAWYVIAITSLLEFLIPVIAVAYFNVYIYRRLWKRGNLSRHRSRLLSVSSCDGGQTLRWGLFSEKGDPSLHSQGQGRKSNLLASFRSQKKSKMIHASKGSSLAHADSLSLHHREHVELLRSRKLAKSLAVLLAVFAICWAPYSLFTIVISTYPPAERPKSSWYEFAFWLQWFNSFINPVLYPLCHKRFQKAFLKLFCVKKQLITSQSQSFSSSR
ncbi:histamine H4 receptor isoform X2 [Ochotona curzoniae]|uniref:histamine H4 receptor isoform X2 n=1 Tax=Ochotona curzoniae TaxID=130825 RepID=UPI001B3491DC|nr:histamine H4 receptor isoform X2 [Ochotona curzoniae]